MRTYSLTDAEIRGLGYRALVETLGAVGAAGFSRQHDTFEDDYLKVRDQSFEVTNADEIYDEAVRLEAERKEERGEG